ncbi:MAG TPA: potassium channel family protein [Candidatus Binatia bacterium]|nr:potassium channel family protein [Candidatus Binatia bacterium]
MLDDVLHRYLRHRFSWLFVSLLLTIGAQPVADAFAPGVNPLEVLLAVNLLAAIGGAAHDRSFRVLLVLVIALGASRVITAAMGVEGLLPISHALWVLAGILATVATVRHALRATSVDTEHIFAALDAYLLAGLMFGVVYWVMDQHWHPAFGAPTDGDLALPEAIYFSFVTIATVGYGDIVPVGSAARSLAILEAVGGQMYLAVLVARLVGLHVVTERRE